MTLRTLSEIRYFLSKLVVHGDDQVRLLHLIDQIDLIISHQKAKSQAA